MSGSVEIVLWLHEYELRALEKQLASNGTDVEKRMQEMLADLYSECVPFEERQAIQERINAEHAEAVADQMANTTWAAYHITGHGEDLYFKTSKADTLLAAAKRLRTYLTAEDNPQPVSFAAVLKDRTEITRAEYDQLLDQRLQNTGKVSGVFEMDFDRDTFSAANAMDGWHTYRIHDVSVAAYARVSHGIYQKTEQSPVQQESVGCHTPSAYDLLDILFVVQNQMEAIHKTQQEEFPSNKTLENSFQVVSGHLETLLDSMSMWIADTEDLTQVPLQENENEALTGMQMG